MAAQLSPPSLGVLLLSKTDAAAIRACLTEIGYVFACDCLGGRWHWSYLGVDDFGSFASEELALLSAWATAWAFVEEQCFGCMNVLTRDDLSSTLPLAKKLNFVSLCMGEVECAELHSMAA